MLFEVAYFFKVELVSTFKVTSSTIIAGKHQNEFDTEDPRWYTIMMGGASSKQKDSSHLPDVDVPYSENNYPPLKPPKTKKDIVYNPRLFTAIDAKASVTSRDDALSYQTLIKHLTEGLQNDVQKVRSIFVWLASQQIMYDNFDDVVDVNTPLGYMRLIQDDRGTYEQFFALLCRKAKIPCMVVQGNIKSATYEVGDMDIECIYGHWNLVYLDGSWRIVNPKWAMVSIGNYSTERWRMIEKDGKAEQPDREEGSLVYVYSQDDFYFLTDPEDHIYRCLPTNAKWQLLGEPWSMEKFLMVPLVHNDFFASGLKLPEGQQGILGAKEGEVEINFQVTKGAKDIKYELYCDRKSKKKLHGDSQMSRYVFVNNIRSTRSFFIRLQTEGRYMLTILNDTDTPLCDFRIDCSGVKGTCEPFPKNPAIGWGFNETTKRAGLSSPSQESGIVTIDSKKSVDITFKTRKGVDVKANLLHNEIPTTELEKHVNQQKDGDKLTVTVDIPTTSTKQEYALEINAKDSATAKHQNVANYLLTTQKNKPHDIASRGIASTTNSGKHSNETKTNGYIKKENPAEPSVDKQNESVQTKGMFSFLSSKPKTKGPSSEETGGGKDKAANGSIPSKQSQTVNSDTKTGHTAVDKAKDNSKEPSQQSLTSKLKNKTYSFKIKNKETSQDYESCGLSPEGVPNGNQAVESIHKLPGSRHLKKAIENRRLSEINKLLEETGVHSPDPKLTELKEKAETVRTVIKRMNKYLHEVMAVNQGTIAEIHSYSHPKPIVHDVMRATFLLLGERGAQLRKWHYIQQLMRRTSKDGLIVRIQEFDVSSISWELAEYVKLILDGRDPDEVRLTSTGAGAFYIW
ncbi:lim and transglutaminase domain protein ltd-1-like, partial [Haliotis rubra]|uniref:lim and transglutaminase domain protein ltd-1-like n=1 Tax=Haliotis rubra TaxID=36100 RepID=UPI001EE62959